MLDRPRCLEFGPGPFSTPLLLRHASWLISVEHDPAFARHLGFPCTADIAHEVIIETDLSRHIGIARRLGPFDLVFIDGAREVRADLVLATLQLSRVVIAHDTDKPSYNWERLDALGAETRVDFTAEPPWTTVFSIHGELLEPVRAFRAAFDANPG